MSLDDPLRFLGALSPADPRASEAPVALLGVPYDGAVTYRAGACEGPDALRRASDSIETYCPKLDGDLADLDYVDLGDLDCARDGDGATAGERVVNALSRQLAVLAERPLLAIGGDHLVALPFLRRALARHDRLQVVHIDAHFDLREAWLGEPFNHATVIARARDAMGPGHRLHHWGIRSGERREFELVRDDPRMELLAPQPGPMLARLEQLLARGLPIYLTLDVDGIDPADIPGTGTPEPDGLAFGWVEAAIERLARAPTDGPGLVGADLVELAPGLDTSGRSAVAAARLVRGLLLALAR